MKKLFLFLFLFSGLNVIFIPLISFYGLRACPIMNLAGFKTGCIYSASFVFLINFFNLTILFFSLQTRFKNLQQFIKKNSMSVTFYIYILATLIALIVLEVLFKMNHLTGSSRAPEILVFASLMLAIVQTYGLAWVKFNEPLDLVSEVPSGLNVLDLWLGHLFKLSLPLLIGFGVLIHFLISQSQQFNQGRVAPTETTDNLILQSVYLIIFLISWLFIVYIFYFLSEKQMVSRVQLHLQKLSEFDINFSSSLNGSWGLWFGFLSQLNDFSKNLGEKKLLLNNFSKFVAKDVAEKALNQNLSSSDDHLNQSLQKDMTVLMMDIRGFTQLSTDLKPRQVVELLNKYFNFTLSIMAKYSLSIDKYIGDGILAYVEEVHFSSSTHDNELAVRASFEILEKLNTFNEELLKSKLPTIKVGIGIYRGPLIVGMIGTDTKLQHTIIGDTVNRASRFESLTKKLDCSVILSKQIYEGLPLDLKKEFENFGLQEIRGTLKPMEVFGHKQRISQ